MIVGASSPVRLFRPFPGNISGNVAFACGSAERRPTRRNFAHALVGRDSVEPRRHVQEERKRAALPLFRLRPDGRRTGMLPSRSFCRQSGACDLAMPEITCLPARSVLLML